jgi:hypothetical protein
VLHVLPAGAGPGRPVRGAQPDALLRHVLLIPVSAGRNVSAVTQWDLEMLATELRRHSEDLSLYAGFLLGTLSAAMPVELVAVERKGSLLRRLRGAQAPVVAATVRLGEDSPCAGRGSALRRWPRSGTSPAE